MEERSPKNAVLQTVKTVLIVLAVFAAAILYIFISSAAEGRNYKGKTADMYGIDSLEYKAEPVMRVYVWQKNEENPGNNDQYLGGSSYFYDLISLPLIPGESVNTVSDTLNIDTYNPSIVLTAEYDGEFYGEYEIESHGQLIYSGSKSAIPGLNYSSAGGKRGSAPEMRQMDSSFSAVDVVTMRISQKINSIYYAVLNNNVESNITVQGTAYAKGYDLFNDYTVKQKLGDIYPEAPKELRDLERYVFTTHLKIYAKHPEKSDTVVAETELAIHQISYWVCSDAKKLELLEKSEYNIIEHTNVEVVSYTQSDMFAFE